MREVAVSIYITKDAWERFLKEGEATAILRGKFHPGRNKYVRLDVNKVISLQA